MPRECRGVYVGLHVLQSLLQVMLHIFLGQIVTPKYLFCRRDLQGWSRGLFVIIIIIMLLNAILFLPKNIYIFCFYTLLLKSRLVFTSQEYFSGKVIYIKNLPKTYYTDSQFVKIVKGSGTVKRYFLIRTRQEVRRDLQVWGKWWTNGELLTESYQ